VRRILFVDDERNMLDSMRDALRRYRNRYALVFALSGREALTRLSADPFDVVVSDMRMPGMDGATLLAEVQALYPRTVRIVLSGYTELDVAVRAAAVAHLFLAKPCTIRELMATIDRACVVCDLVGDSTLLATVGEISTLPSVPATHARLDEALADPATTAGDAAVLVERDMAMSAKVLQLVNSAFFQLDKAVTSISEGVSYLGIRTLRVLASASTFKAFDPIEPPGRFSIDDLQEHSLLVGRVATGIADEAEVPEDLLAAGLLHDVGKLVLAARLPGQLSESLAIAAGERAPLFLVEQRQYQATHAEVGACLLGLWGLPDRLVEAVAHHHRPERVSTTELSAATIVHVADALAHEVAPIADEPGPAVDEDHLARIGMKGRLPAWRCLAQATAEEAYTKAAGAASSSDGRTGA
jgi:putative nucleotidyltransferase with HDIG domain